MRNAIKILLGAVLFLAATMTSGPAAKACPDAEIDTNYFNADGCWIGETLFDCFCDHGVFGTLDGAKWKHQESFPCGDGTPTSVWFVKNPNTGLWESTSDPGLPGC
jgi:hypothetical protein